MLDQVLQDGEAAVEGDAHILYCETSFQYGKTFRTPPKNRSHDRNRLRPQRPQPEPAGHARAAPVRQHHAGRGGAAVPAGGGRTRTGMRIPPDQPRGRDGGLGAGGAREGGGARHQPGRPVVPLHPAAGRAQDPRAAHRRGPRDQHPPARPALPALAGVARRDGRDLRLRRLRLRAGDPGPGAAPGRHRHPTDFAPRTTITTNRRQP